MGMNFKPVHFFKITAVTLSCWTMCFAPLAMGAEAEKNNKELINRYLKETGLTTQKMTVGQFWGMVRHVYPAVLQKQLDPWMAAHKDEAMPKIEANVFKDADNNEQVRLLLTKDSETHTLTFTGDEDKPLKVDNVVLTKSEVLNYNKFPQLAEKIAKEDSTLPKSTFDTKNNSTSSVRKPGSTADKKSDGKQKIVKFTKNLKGRDIAKLPLRQQMDYLLKMRRAAEAADRVLESQRKPAGKGAFYEFSKNDSAAVALWRLLLGAEASAKPSKKSGSSFVGPQDPSCIASGWVAMYHKGSCARPEAGQKALLEQVDSLRTGNVFPAETVSKISACVRGGGLPCNPLLYGFQPSGVGEPICISSDLPSATKQCSSQVPLPSKKEQIIQSIAKARGGQDGLCKMTDKDGVALVSHACSEKLDQYTNELTEHYLNAAKFCTKGGVSSVDSAKEWEAKARKDIRTDQIQACENLKDRYFDLKVESIEKIDSCAKIPGTYDVGGKCVCEDGKDPHPRPVAVPAKPSEEPAAIPALPNPNDPVQPGASTGVSDLTCEQVNPLPPEQPADKKDPAVREAPKDECQESFWCRNKNWLIPLGVGLAAFGLIWWIAGSGKKKKTTPTYTPPLPPPLPTPAPTPSPSPDPLPVNPCPAPNTVINGVCTSPVIVPPPPLLTEGGSGAGPQGFGGVR